VPCKGFWIYSTISKLEGKNLEKIKMPFLKIQARGRVNNGFGNGDKWLILKNVE
jgi:hypothetical protein